MEPPRASLFGLTDATSNLGFSAVAWARHCRGPESTPIPTVAILIILTLSMDLLTTRDTWELFVGAYLPEH